MNLITYLIPVFNEFKTVKEAIDKVIDLDFNIAEILIIDNGSKDGSVEIIKKFKNYKNVKIILKDKNYGWGDTFRKALKNATGKYLYIHHSDNEYDINACKEAFALCEFKNYDVVFCSRLKNLSTFNDYIKILINNHYYLATIVFTFLANILYRKNFTDITGTKFLKLKTAQGMKIVSENVSFEYELNCKLCESGILSSEIYIKYKPRKNSEEKSVKWYHFFIGVYDIIYTRIFRYKE
jgi:glycosyltransferase involved in cell wall biosynthesis